MGQASHSAFETPPADVVDTRAERIELFRALPRGNQKHYFSDRRDIHIVNSGSAKELIEVSSLGVGNGFRMPCQQDGNTHKLRCRVIPDGSDLNFCCEPDSHDLGLALLSTGAEHSAPALHSLTKLRTFLGGHLSPPLH